MIREASDCGLSAVAAGFSHNIESNVNANVPLTVYVEFSIDGADRLKSVTQEFTS
jgi:hypothetical protein